MCLLNGASLSMVHFQCGIVELFFCIYALSIVDTSSRKSFQRSCNTGKSMYESTVITKHGQTRSHYRVIGWSESWS